MYFTVLYFNKTWFLVRPINVYDYIKQNKMPTIRLRIKFSKTAFLNTLKFAINRACLHLSSAMDIPPVPNQPKTFKFPQRCFGKTNPVRWGCGRHLKNSYNACKISLGSQAKMVSKCNRIASLVILNYKIFLGEVPQTPLTRGGSTHLSSFPPRVVGTRWTPTVFNGPTTF